MTKAIWGLLFVILSTTPAIAQQSHWRDSLAEAFIKKFDKQLPSTLFQDESKAIYAIEELEKLASNENRRIRSYAHFKISEIGLHNKTNFGSGIF
ncbi:MAG: hypothetical protein R2830_10095 [Saprospiraceae bacterium]